MTAVLVAVLVLGLPLGVAIAHLVESDERAELEALALRAAVGVSPANLTERDPAELPTTEDGTEVGVYDLHGRRLVGTGPRALEAGASGAFKGDAVAADFGEKLVQAVPVSSRERVFAVVRAASPESHLLARDLLWWLCLLGACLVAAVCASLFALRESRRLAVPIVNLARVAQDIGEGDFTPRSIPTGVPEIDTVGTALTTTAQRLADLLERERSFVQRASHQLRTPLTQLQLQLEVGLQRGDLRDAATSALDAADRLSQTIDDLLLVARGAPPTVFDLTPLVHEVAGEWHGALAAAGRPLHVTATDVADVAASRPGVRQVLHVLLDNALTHGCGEVSVVVREAHGAVAVDVTDQGSAPPIRWDDAGRMGLSLARSLAAANGGRLLVDQSGSGTRFTLLLRSG
jgi:signal transduction histidine kinase